MAKLTGCDLLVETFGESFFWAGMMSVGSHLHDRGLFIGGIIGAVLIVWRRKVRSRTSRPIEDDTGKT